MRIVRPIRFLFLGPIPVWRETLHLTYLLGLDDSIGKRVGVQPDVCLPLPVVVMAETGTTKKDVGFWAKQRLRWGMRSTVSVSGPKLVDGTHECIGTVPNTDTCEGTLPSLPCFYLKSKDLSRVTEV